MINDPKPILRYGNPAYCLQNLLGKVIQETLVPEKTAYFWDGFYYPVDKLETRLQTIEGEDYYIMPGDNYPLFIGSTLWMYRVEEIPSELFRDM